VFNTNDYIPESIKIGSYWEHINLLQGNLS